MCRSNATYTIVIATTDSTVRIGTALATLKEFCFILVMALTKLDIELESKDFPAAMRTWS